MKKILCNCKSCQEAETKHILTIRKSRKDGNFYAYGVAVPDGELIEGAKTHKDIESMYPYNSVWCNF